LDRAVIEQARSGDRDAFATIVHERMESVYRLSLAILGDEADARDATQETFVATWRRLASLRDIDRFDAWFQRIAVNAARMTLRGRRRRQVREIASEDVARRAGIDPTTTTNDADRLGRAIAELSVDQRTILALHHLEGQGLAEIANVLGIPVGTAKSRLFSARRKLERTLAEADR
jgi:RNA polymerase sigma-70 factor (ECF subfamily)